MTDAAAGAGPDGAATVGVADVRAALDAAHRRAWALVLAATVPVCRDLDVAEECVQEAYAAAMTAWLGGGIPRNPDAWLTVSAKRRAVDAVRRASTLRAKLPLLVEPMEHDSVEAHVTRAFGDDPEPDIQALAEAVPDERLRLIFLCCHPALAKDARLALTLRLVCGLPTPDIARLLVVPTATVAARMTRAKKKIAAAGIPYRVPSAAELPDRLDSVLAVIHLLYTSGHTSPSGAELMRTDLADRALQLAGMLRSLMPDEPEAAGLLALLLLTDARRSTRTDARGRLLRLQDQDRSQWDRDAIAEARGLLAVTLRAGRPGRYALQAAIAERYVAAPTFDETDWPGILTLYDALLRVWPSPIVALNRTIALAEVDGPTAALAEVEAVEGDGRLTDYQYLWAVKGELLLRAGRRAEAASAWRRAADLTENDAERALLFARIREADS